MGIIKKAKNITINVKGQYTMIAGTFTEVADKITITATNGNLTLSSIKKVIIQGLDGGVKFGEYIPPQPTEKTITEIIWMNSEMEKKIDNARVSESPSIKVKTENYKAGEIIKLSIKEQEGQDIQDNKKEIQLIGFVDNEGYALLQEIIYLDENQIKNNSNIA